MFWTGPEAASAYCEREKTRSHLCAGRPQLPILRRLPFRRTLRLLGRLHRQLAPYLTPASRSSAVSSRRLEQPREL